MYETREPIQTICKPPSGDYHTNQLNTPWSLPRGFLFPVPTASSRVRERGYDQAVIIAKQISQASAIPFSIALARLNQAHRVGATRADRKRHVLGCFRVRKTDSLVGKNALLVDDVCTTGATLEEAARTLKAVGVKTVSAIVFSQPN